MLINAFLVPLHTLKMAINPSDKRNITAITAKYRIRSNVVEILAHMLGIRISVNKEETFPLTVENISGKILLRFNCQIPIINIEQLIRIIDSKLKFPENYTRYMLKTIDRTSNPPTSEFITESCMATVSHENQRYTVKYIHPNYIDLCKINVFVIIFAGDASLGRSSLIHMPNGYDVKIQSNWYCKTHLSYRIEYNLIIIKILFGDKIYDIVRDVVDNYKIRKNIDRETQRTLNQLYSVIGKNLDVTINGKLLTDVISDVRILLIHKYYLPSDFNFESRLYKWSLMVNLLKHSDSVKNDIELQPITYRMQINFIRNIYITEYQARFVR